MSYELIINPIHKTDSENPIHKAASEGNTDALRTAIENKGTLTAQEVFDAVIASDGNGPVVKVLMLWMHNQTFSDLTDELLFSVMDQLISENLFTAADIVRRHTKFVATEQLYINALGRGDFNPVGEKDTDEYFSGIGTQLEHIHKFGAKWSPTVTLAAASMGRVESLKWLQKNNCPIDWDKCLHASIDSKSVEILEWMYDIEKIQPEHFDAIYTYAKTQGKIVKVAILAWLLTHNYIKKSYWCLCVPRKRISAVTVNSPEEETKTEPEVV